MQNPTFHTEACFEQLNQDRKATQAAYHFISDRLRKALEVQDIPLLLSLIPYIESGEGQLPYKYIGETSKILLILHIIDLERKYQMSLFCYNCLNQNALMEKHLLSLFALRRLFFRLSERSMEEASLFLRQSRLSVFAVYLITQADLIQPDRSFLHKITKLYADCWSQEESTLFTSLAQSG